MFKVVIFALIGFVFFAYALATPGDQWLAVIGGGLCLGSAVRLAIIAATVKEGA